jgi:hypothetical protein
VALRGQTAPGGEVELPVVETAGENAVFDCACLRKIGTKMRAAALNEPVAEANVFSVV